MSINIGRDNNDSSYRYKMPKLVTKVEGRGNGIKTVIVNMVDIAKALHIEPAYPTKFFGFELGAQSKFNAGTERAIVNGNHNQPDLAQLLDKFIHLLILCPTCSLPELVHDIRKNNIKIDCQACGHNGDLHSSHKVVQYICKTKKGKDGDKKKKKKDKKDKKKGKKDGEESGEESAEEKTEIVKKPKKKKEDTKWHTDTSEEAIVQRKLEEFNLMSKGDQKSKSVEAILTQAKSENKVEAPVTVLKIFLASKERTDDEIMSELRRLQLARGLDEAQKIKVLLDALIDVKEPKKIGEEFTKKGAVFGKFPASSFMSCLEEYVGVTYSSLLARTPIILQALYELDVLEEEAILKWADAPPESSWLVNKEVAVSVRSKAAPFIEWLKSAESDSE